MNRITTGLQLLVSYVSALSAVAADGPDFNRQIQPIFTKYCTGCHNDEDREGQLSLASYDTLLKGGAKGSVVNPGHADLSRLVLVVTGKAEPAMPPKDNERPKPEEIRWRLAW